MGERELRRLRQCSCFSIKPLKRKERKGAVAWGMEEKVVGEVFCFNFGKSWYEIPQI